jgi:acetoin utilization deacetylase AcuC-like enzyme
VTTALFAPPACLLHDNGPCHPESPDRLRAILAELHKPAYKALRRFEAPQATIEQIARVHDRTYVEGVLTRVPSKGYVMLDGDTSMSPGSGEAALRAAGAVCAAVDEVMSGKTTNAFCAVRPPGHHAERSNAMGFCLFNNIAIGAAHALAVHNLKRVAVVDFDVHHGNGTQDYAQGEARVLFCSTHEFPFYPGTGAADEQGLHGNLVNVPLSAGADGALFRQAMQKHVFPAVEKFAPELILISAGFDAHRDDPLGDLQLTEDDYSWVTDELATLANRLCHGRIVSTLEGGYDLDALAASARAHIKALMKPD